MRAGSVILAVKGDATNFAKSVKDEVKSKTRGIGEAMGGHIRDGLKSMAGPIAAVTATFGVEKIVEGSISAFEDSASSIRGIQRIAGGTVEQISGLRGAMQEAGVDTTNMAQTMRVFSTHIAQAGKDSKKTAEMQKLLGTSIRDAHGNLKPMTELLPQIADKFKSMPDGIQKTALSAQLFGRNGTQMLPFLNKGSAGIEELTQKAKDMGLVLDDTSMKKFADSKKKAREFSLAMQGLQISLGDLFLPILESVQDAIREYFIPLMEKASKWVKAHRKSFEEWGKTIHDKVLPIISTLGDAIGKVIDWILKNRDTVMILVTAIGAGVAAFKAYQIIMGIVKGVQKAWQAGMVIMKIVTGTATAEQLGLNAAMLANPIGIVIAAIVGLIAGLVWFFTQTKLGKKVWADFMKFMSDTMTAIGQWFSDVWQGMVKGWNAFVGFLGDSLNNIGKWFAGLWNGIVDVWNGVGKFFGKVVDGISSIFKGAINGYISMWENLINFVIHGLNFILGGAKWLGPVLGAIGIKVKIGDIPDVHLPRLAKGGIVPATPGGRIVQVAEAGQAEAVIPLNRLNDMLGSTEPKNSSRPIHMDGSFVGVLKTIANGEAKVVFNTQLGKIATGVR